MSEYKKIMYKWIVMDEFGEIVNYGVRDEAIEMLVEKVYHKINSCADRNMSDMQDFIDEHYSELGLTFHYKEVEIDFKECTE